MCFIKALELAENGESVCITDDENTYALEIINCNTDDLTNRVPMLKKARNSYSDSFMYFALSLDAIKSNDWFVER